MGFLESDQEFILEKTKKLAPLLEAKKIFYTGATGFLGKNFIRLIELLNQNLAQPVKLVCSSRTPSSFLQSFSIVDKENISFQKIDLNTSINLENDFDFIVDGASPMFKELDEMDFDQRLNMHINASENIIDFAKTNLKTKVLFLSSGAVYKPGTGNYKEESELKDMSENIDAYSLGKIKCEELYQKNFADLENEYVIARCFSFAGPYIHLDANFALGNFLNDVLEGKNIQINSDGQARRSYLYTIDLIIWLLTIMLKANKSEVYNVGSEQECSIKELAYKLKELSAKNLEINIREELGSGSDSRYIPCLLKAKKDLELDIWHDLDHSLSKTVEWFKSRA